VWEDGSKVIKPQNANLDSANRAKRPQVMSEAKQTGGVIRHQQYVDDDIRALQAQKKGDGGEKYSEPVDAPLEWQKNLLTKAAKEKNAVCLDGSPGAIYFRKGSDAKKKWIVHHNGGGWCSDDKDCLKRAVFFHLDKHALKHPL
jgi:hypothetical protein